MLGWRLFVDCGLLFGYWWCFMENINWRYSGCLWVVVKWRSDLVFKENGFLFVMGGIVEMLCRKFGVWNEKLILVLVWIYFII